MFFGVWASVLLHFTISGIFIFVIYLLMFLQFFSINYQCNLEEQLADFEIGYFGITKKKHC